MSCYHYYSIICLPNFSDILPSHSLCKITTLCMTYNLGNWTYVVMNEIATSLFSLADTPGDQKRGIADRRDELVAGTIDIPFSIGQDHPIIQQHQNNFWHLDRLKHSDSVRSRFTLQHIF